MQQYLAGRRYSSTL